MAVRAIPGSQNRGSGPELRVRNAVREFTRRDWRELLPNDRFGVVVVAQTYERKRGFLAVFALGAKCAVERLGCVHDAG